MVWQESLIGWVIIWTIVIAIINSFLLMYFTSYLSLDLEICCINKNNHKLIGTELHFWFSWKVNSSISYIIIVVFALRTKELCFIEHLYGFRKSLSFHIIISFIIVLLYYYIIVIAIINSFLLMYFTSCLNGLYV